MVVLVRKWDFNALLNFVDKARHVVRRRVHEAGCIHGFGGCLVLFGHSSAGKSDSLFTHDDGQRHDWRIIVYECADDRDSHGRHIQRNVCFWFFWSIFTK